MSVTKEFDGKYIHKPLIAGKYKTCLNHVLILSGNIHKYTDSIHVLDLLHNL